MYTPREFAESRIAVIHEAIRANPFATLVTAGDGGLVATHLPFILEATTGERGTLRGHVARANRQWRDFDGREVLVIFSGPHAYISPNWYETREAVPTWNYLAVHAYGVPRLIEDEAATLELLRAQVATFEAPSLKPWSTDGLDTAWLSSRVKAVMAFEIPISRFEGKAKMSQNRPDEQERVATLLEEAGNLETAREIRTRLSPHTPAMSTDPLDRVRALCIAFPGATEKLSHGEPTWFARGKKSFLMYANHHHDDRLAFWCAAAPGAQDVLVAAKPGNYFVPPYVGYRGWIGAWLDVAVDWDELAGLIAEAHDTVAASLPQPRRARATG